MTRFTRLWIVLVFAASMAAKGFAIPSPDTLQLSQRIARILSTINQVEVNTEYQRTLDSLIGLWRHQKRLPEDSPERERLHWSLAEIFSKAEAHRLAAVHYQVAHEIHMEREKVGDFQMTNAIASAHLRAKDWKHSRYWFGRALDLRTHAGGKASSFNDLGILFFEEGETDSAKYFFGKAIQYWQVDRYDTLFRGSIRDNLAQVYEAAGNLTPALELYLQNTTTYADGRRQHSKIQANLAAARIYLQTERPGQAEKHLEVARQALPFCMVKYKNPLEEEFYRLMVQHGKMTGNKAQEDTYEQKYIQFLERIRSQLKDKINRAIYFQSTFQNAYFSKELEIQGLMIEKEKKKLIQEQERQQFTLILAILILLFLMILGILFIRVQRLRAQSLKEQVEIKQTQNRLLNSQLKEEALQKENLSLMLSLKEQDLTNFALEIEQKTEVLQQMENKLNALRSAEVAPQTIRNLIHELKSKVQNEAMNKVQRENIQQVNAEFRDRLLRVYPDLSPNELDLCGLFRLGLKNKEVASLKNVTENAVKVARRRLRKKLGIEREVDLYQFLQDT